MTERIVCDADIWSYVRNAVELTALSTMKIWKMTGILCWSVVKGISGIEGRKTDVYLN